MHAAAAALLLVAGVATAQPPMPKACITLPKTTVNGCRQKNAIWQEDANDIMAGGAGPNGCIAWQLANIPNLNLNDIPPFWESTFGSGVYDNPHPAVIWIGGGCPRPCALKAIRLGKNPIRYCRTIGQGGGSPPTMLDGGCKIWNNCNIYCRETCERQDYCRWKQNSCQPKCTPTQLDANPAMC